MRLRHRSDAASQCRILAAEVRGALSQLPASEDDPAVIESLWLGEGLGTLLWALELAEMPDYDALFDLESLLETPLDRPRLRSSEEIERERETARLWHWRARTAVLEKDRSFAVPAPWASVAELVASVAERGHEQGLLPEPLTGDFRARGFVYRWVTPRELSELLSLAFERHRALNWLCDPAVEWDRARVDT